MLMYHRVAEPDTDPWNLCVCPLYFDRHIAMLKDNFHVIPMHRLASRVAERDPLTDLVAITFDDGYYDNFEVAMPILQKHNIPGAFFFTTANFGRKGFWWDELEQLILRTPRLPETINLSFGKKSYSLILRDSAVLTDDCRKHNIAWRYGMNFPNSRIKLYLELWSELKFMESQERDKAMTLIKDWVGTVSVPTPPLMSAEQIMQLAGTGLFEIGAHSVSHPALGMLPRTEQHNEIKKSKDSLENLVNLSVTGFAYPYGHYSNSTPSITKSAGFRYAVTTEEKRVSSNCSVFEIPRFQVTNVTADDLLNHIKQWQTR